MARDHFLEEGFSDRIKNVMRRIFRYLPVWRDLLILSLIIVFCLAIMNLSDARFVTKKPLYTNQELVTTVWKPAPGEVARYQLEITDTRFFPGSKEKNAITMVKHATSSEPRYELRCEHNHSYELRAAAISPAGILSLFSPKSTLLICDRQAPRIEIEPLPSPAKLRHPSLTVKGTFVEPNLESITLNGVPVRINLMKNSFSAQTDLQPGKNDLTLVAKDLAGNTTAKDITLDYAPVTIISLPSGANIYWNGNYAYPGMYADTTPQSFNQAVQGRQVLQLTYPGFNNYYGVIDFSDPANDTYTIALTPFSGIALSRMKEITPCGTEDAVHRHACPFVVDYAGDGKKDLLIGTQEGTIALFTNTGSDNLPSFSDFHLLKADGQEIRVGSHAAPFVVDYNNDGIKDLLVGNGEGELFYYPNVGTNTSPVFGASVVLADGEGKSIAVLSYCRPCVVDWNGDNRKDLLLGGGDGTLTLYLNQGSDGNPLFAPSRLVEIDGGLLDVGSNASPFVTDWNGDGKKDLLVGDGDGFIHVFLDVSTTGEPQLIAAGKVTVSDQDLRVEGSAAPFLLDWNNDGKKDLLVGSEQGNVYLFTH